MKKCISMFFFILLTSFAFAGTTSLTTWYPPPTASYNAVKLAANYISSAISSAAGCTNNNIGTIFLDSVTENLYQCTGAGTANPYCTNANNGTLLTDSNGTLHVCMAGVDSAYPQGCYNSFCTYDTSQNAGGCTPFPVCQAGFTQVPVGGPGYDNIPTSATTYINSYACCSSSMFSWCLNGPINGNCTLWGTCTTNVCGAQGTQVCQASTSQCGGTPIVGATKQSCTAGVQNGNWSAWTACSAQCNGTETETCNNPPACNGGANCPGCIGAGCSLNPSVNTRACGNCPSPQICSCTTAGCKGTCCTPGCDGTCDGSKDLGCGCNNPAPLACGCNNPGHTCGSFTNCCNPGCCNPPYNNVCC